MRRHVCYCGRRFWTRWGFKAHLKYGGTSFGSDPLGTLHWNMSYPRSADNIGTDTE